MFHQLKYGMKVAGWGPGNKAMEDARVPWRGREESCTAGERGSAGIGRLENGYTFTVLDLPGPPPPPPPHTHTHTASKA